MASRAGQKRSAASSAGSEPSTSSSGTHAPKKTRFVEPEDDPANFAEQVDASLEDKPRRSKGVKNEGYESDSSDDGEGVVNSRKKGAKGDDDEEDEDDMFAAVDKEEKEEEVAGKKKDKFMRLGDIEGQEFNNGSDESGEEDFEDEDARERKKKEGMGFELSSFNMREEMEEGKFTEDGSYIRSVDPHQVHDKWMDGLDDREIKLARKRKRDQEKKQREKIEREERELAESGGPVAIERKLLPLLRKGESVLEALQRLGAKAKRKQPAKKPAKRKAGEVAMSVDKESIPPTDIELITDLASQLMSLGDSDAYSKTYEEIVRHVRSSGDVEPSWEPPSADVKYEYCWDKPGSGQTDQVFGPFSEDDMKSWYKAAYFGQYGEQVKVRPAGGEGEWGDWSDIIE
ncbi:hypothetical protein D9611_004775 [Ephemerocybe angulata]|uniref:GYF domain-containing protein n=1 Tax=Ephemerocybe angulata TaxID=980116 RepID=A0A8H5EX30_9AGAR|nr:hypothetical protein D9611_004775 [Tulosesus angulatus]